MAAPEFLVVYVSEGTLSILKSPDPQARESMRKLEQRIETRAPQQAVWEVLADFGGVEKWAPGMRRSNLLGDQDSGVGTRRVMRHRWGFRIEELVTEWSEGEAYAFELLQAPFPMTNVYETWDLASEDGQTTIVTTVSYEMSLGVIGTLLDYFLVRFLVAREMRAGLRALACRTSRTRPVRGTEFHRNEYLASSPGTNGYGCDN
jgi:ligand-binding SRPBCC domain-containing protein